MVSPLLICKFHQFSHSCILKYKVTQSHNKHFDKSAFHLSENVCPSKIAGAFTPESLLHKSLPPSVHVLLFGSCVTQGQSVGRQIEVEEEKVIWRHPPTAEDRMCSAPPQINWKKLCDRPVNW
ncbi:hypothetical protein Y1Q_0023199 [Alligator mississippiensis]|uniref:Uncharacterized protein n=1 Tax=Alligator mississippiensis TaxID=8496 RepID=A0A151MZ76_ALLMI|nr:hypothetical protein Y1Q_0023199 [Alligator mississippiensis]